MTSAREQILGAVKQSLKRNGPNATNLETCEQRLSDPEAGLIPERSRLPHPAQIDLMEAMLIELSATVQRVSSDNQVPDAVVDYLKTRNLPQEIRLAPSMDLLDLPWDGHSLLKTSSGPAREPDQVSVTGAFAGVAETGTLMLHSGPEGPTTLNFLPENHIVVLRTSQVVGAYEEGWARLRKVFGNGVMPRTVNMISGPSRTGDIEQKIELGAHGPRRLHVIVIEDGDSAA
ncbi:lactate utilization protein [Pelagibius sp. Alg239-R121]|uniref:LutC/YkgG family protein n=1 Tax=Pelagibius sp. Alg239-R121 TaxID=2993448 RepID=UPI0024A7547C|nr:lactate utilization protein [Pelagibius sp. Alg239-R121]